MMDKGHETTDKKLRSMERKVKAIYNTAQKEAKKKLDDYLSKFAETDAKKQDDLNAGKITQEQYDKWRQSKILTGNRYRAMLEQLAEDYVNADKIAMSIINGYMPEVYAINFNYGTYEAEKGSLIDTSFTLYDQQTVERLIRDDPDLAPNMIEEKTPDIPKDTRWNRQHINSAITQGVLQGDSIPHIADRLQSVTNMSQKAAIRNARTMTTSAENGGRMDSYHRAEKMGIKMRKQWISTLDTRTRFSHRQLDTEVVETDKPFSNGLMFPGDPNGRPEEVWNCRCTLVAVVAGIDPSIRPDAVSRNSKLGGMTYDEWKEEHQQRAYARTARAQKSEQTADTANTIINGKDVAWRLTDSSYRSVETVAEAEQYAKDAFVEGGGFNLTGKAVSFKGVDIDTANRINQRLTSIYEQFDITKLSSLESFGKVNKKVFSKHADAPFITTNFGNIGINSTIVKNAKELEKYNERGRKSFQYVMDNMDKLTGEQKQIALAYQKAGKSLVGDSLEDMITHEIGHHISYMPKVNSRLGEIQKSTDWKKTAEELSGYANHSFGEYVAESFNAYCRGERDKLQPEMIQLFDSLRR